MLHDCFVSTVAKGLRASRAAAHVDRERNGVRNSNVAENSFPVRKVKVDYI